jgi:hypothetical protein
VPQEPRSICGTLLVTMYGCDSVTALEQAAGSQAILIRNLLQSMHVMKTPIEQTILARIDYGMDQTMLRRSHLRVEFAARRKTRTHPMHRVLNTLLNVETCTGLYTVQIFPISSDVLRRLSCGTHACKHSKNSSMRG